MINVMLQVACVLAAGAQVQEPCGVYEAADKVDGLTRQCCPKDLLTFCHNYQYNRYLYTII